MNKEQFENLKKVDTSVVAYGISEALRVKTQTSELREKTIAVAISLLKLQELNNPYIDKFDFFYSSILNGDAKDVIKKYVDDVWDVVIGNLFKFTNEQLKAFVLFDNSFERGKGGELTTPDSISKLACKILNVKNDEKLLELCTGQGGFAAQCFIDSPGVKYEGVELNPVAIDVATMKLSLVCDDFKIEKENSLLYRTDNKADKLFSNYPFMLRTPELNVVKVKLANNFNMPIETIQRSSSDWLFNLTMVEQMSANGKAVAIMTNGSTWNASDINVRKYFVDNGLIEAVISLPSKMFYDTSIPTTLIVFSKNNDRVQLVDASDICITSRRINEFSDDNIERIIELLNCDSAISLSVTKEELSENEYVLYASRYLNKTPEVENGVEFESIVKNITRGSQLKASELDELKANEATPYEYLMLANVDNGIVELGEDQYLIDMPKKLEKYCVKDNSIVLSKIGVPNFKSAVVNVPEGRKLLANGNLFVIEIDESKADPYYIQAYFSSEAGIAAFKNIYSGVTLATISLDKIKKMIIPLPDLDKQREISKKYKACIDEIAYLKKRLNEITNQVSHILDEN